MAYEAIMVTGASGFVGRYLLRALSQAFPKARLHATSRHVHEDMTDAKWHVLDITDTDATRFLLGLVRPTALINLAAYASVAGSFAHPDACWEVNLQGTLNLLQAAAAQKLPPVFLQVGSGDMYGASFKHSAHVNELIALHPLNPYSASKAAADLAAAQFAATSKLHVIRARPFNHSGAGQSKGYVLTDFASQIANIEIGLQPPVIKVGDLNAKRDFLPVTEVVHAYVELLRHAGKVPSGTAVNIASGKPIPIKELLNHLVTAAQCKIEVEVDPARLRPSEIPCASGDPSLLERLIGWKPSCDHYELAASVLEDWRLRVKKDRSGSSQ
ncbi:GDP-mannose 4,6-dehydratase [Pseudomonas sp. MAG002Y]|uniref:GDP-mannose 4,6-dehydratase n=1 Tax=Pseudomonas sp. MAG002Y TaxID=2678690 RepID=UPI001C60C7BC|nr:GDP-mannose 4,6-dehydratase [Pseudomonas sp. MAG002Y]MBW5413102.1 NAD-dependent epimerase/dehydratase family protein [Pseudomonas sp. MAG002Y]